MNRRQFIQTGLTGSLLLAGAGTLSSCTETPRPEGFKFLNAAGIGLITALIPVILDGALPTDSAAKAVAVADALESFDRAIAGMPRSVQAEIGELVGLLTFAPTRRWVAGVTSDWPSASPAEITDFLTRWQHSRFQLMQSGYQALTQLILAGWYGNPLAWGKLGYIPPNPL